MNDKKQMTEEEFLNHIGFESLEEYSKIQEFEDLEYQKRMDDFYKENPHLLEDNQGYYEDELGEGHYNENLADFDKITNIVTKDLKKIEKKVLYIKDDIAKGFDVNIFNDNFKDVYGKIEERDFKIYYFLRHHISYGRTKLIRDSFSREIDCIKNFMEIEEIVYRRCGATAEGSTEGYEIPFAGAIKNYGDTFDFIKIYVGKLIKLLNLYGIKDINHTPILFKSDFHLIHDIKMKEPVVELYEKIKFSGNKDAISTLSSIICKENSPQYRKAVDLVLYHWIWSIKYKMRKFLNIESPLDKLKDYSLYEPIAPVLYGGQGVGKSVLITKLTQPFKDAGILGNATTVSLFENYTYDMISRNFIIVMDDFQQIERNKIPVFKDMISGDSRTGRQKGDQSAKSFKSVASFILASNEPLNDMLPDTTGNRRFFEIEVKKSSDALIKRNFLAIWKSVDENSEPVKQEEFEKYVKPIQEKNKKLTRQQEFINEFQLFAVDYEKQDANKKYLVVPTSTLIKIYSEWGGFKINANGEAFKTLLLLLNTKSHVLRVAGYPQRVILFEDSCTYEFVAYLTKYKTRNK